MQRTLGIAAIILLAGTNTFAGVTVTPASPTTAPAAPTTQSKVWHAPTFDEMQKKVDAGNYREALQDAIRVYPQSGSANSIYDRFDLLMLTAECQLQLRAQGTAAESYHSAQLLALKTLNFGKAALPTAMIMLIKQSVAFQYHVKTGVDAGKDISVLDRAKRKDAFTALLADSLPPAKRQVDSLNTATTLEPVIDIATSIGTVRDVELSIAAPLNTSTIPARTMLTTSTPYTDPLCAGVSTSTKLLVDKYIADLRSQVESIAATANTVVTVLEQNYDGMTKRAWTTPVTRRQGLTSDQTAWLQNTLVNCEKVHKGLGQIGKALGSQIQPLEVLDAKIKTMKIRINAVLNDNYRTQTPTTPQPPSGGEDDGR